METTPQTFEAFAIIELFGHSKLAGKCTEQNVAGTNFLRVDVPKTSSNPPYSRLLNHAAIYAINPVTEEVANAYAERLQVAPLTAWDVREHTKMINAQLTGGQKSEGVIIPGGDDFPDRDEDDDDDDDDR